MQKKFICGTFTASHGAGNTSRWHITINEYTIAVVDPDGILIKFTELTPLLSDSDLLQILSLMNYIKRQYNQLHTTY